MRGDLCVVLLATLGGCYTASMDPEAGMPPAGPVNVATFQGRLREIAAGYEAYARADDELHWAPGLCRQPEPSRPRRSASGDLDTHGRKLYFVFAADREGYIGRPGKAPDAVGQVLVKEAWTAVEVPADTKFEERQSPVQYLRDGEHLYHAEKKAGLFIMYRLDPQTAATDQGWVYGTVAPDGTVTSAGRVESCMGCHEQAPHGRVFGIPYHGA